MPSIVGSVVGGMLAKMVDLRAVLARRAEREFRRQCVVGEKARFTGDARCYNHSREREHIRIGRGVLVDGIVACHPGGCLSIGDYSFLGKSRIFCVREVRIGRGVLISDNVAIMDSDMHSPSAARRYADAVAWAEEGRFPAVRDEVERMPVIVHDYAWIGFGACILKGVVLGRGAQVGAGSVVTRSVPDWAVVAGNPARVVGEIAPETYPDAAADRPPDLVLASDPPAPEAVARSGRPARGEDG